MRAIDEWNTTGKVVGSLALSTCLLTAHCPAAQLANSTEQSVLPTAGIRVVEVRPSSVGQSAGVQAGDVLTGWSFQGTHDQTARGMFRSPFDLLLIEEEYALRGPVEIAGKHNQAAIRLVLKAAPWGISAGPTDLEHDPADDVEARSLYMQGKTAEAGQRWEKLGREHPRRDAGWFNEQAAQAFADVPDWRAVDRNFAAALESAGPDSASRLEINSAWAAAFQKRALWSDATTRYQSALDDTAKLDAKLTRSRLLMRLVQINQKLRQPARALPLSQEALAIRKKLVPGTYAEAESILLTGSCYLDMQQLDKAEASVSEAQTFTQSMKAPDILQAKVLHNLGLVQQARGKIKEARDSLERSLQISGALDANGEQFASTNSSLGNLLRDQGDFVSAEQHLKLSLEIRRKTAPGTLALASALNNLGTLHRYKGDFVQAQTEYEEALTLIHRLAPKTRDEAGQLQNLGGLAQNRGDQPLAADYYQRSIDLWSEIAPKSALWARTVVNLGQVRQDQGNLKEAERLYNEAVAVPEWQITSPINMAGMDQALGELYTAQGRVQEAIDVNLKALAVYMRISPGGLKESDVAERLGELARTKGDWVSADQYYQQALKIQEHLVPDTTDLAQSLHGLGLVARHAGNKESAITLLSRSVDALEAQSARLGGSELVNAGYRASFSQYYRDLADMLLSVQQNEDAFNVTERYRARSLLDQLTQRNLSFANAPQELTAQLRANAKEYEQLQEQIKQQSPTQQNPEVDEVHKRLLELAAARAQTIDDIRRQSPGYAQLRFPSALNAKEALAALDPGTVLISFLIEPSKTYAFVLNSATAQPGLSVFSIPIDESVLRAKVQAFRLAIEGSERKDHSDLRREAKELYELLLRPAEASIAQSQRVLILPDGPLYVLPFSALLRGEEFMAEWKPVSTTLSATLFAQLKKERRLPATYRVSLAAFGDAIYKPGPDPALLGRNLQNGQRSVMGGALAPLPYSKLEAENIAQLFPGSSQLYEGASATEEHAKSLGTDVRFIHFAVHGLLDEERPLDSALVFTKPVPPQPGSENGFLQAWELYQDAHWDADLVVLSACESALGKELAGEGLVGLTRAVHYAGARSVISSLWNVDDQKTEPLMRELYSNLRDGKSKDEALRLAQLKLLRSRASAAPFYWAAFGLQGDWK